MYKTLKRMSSPSTPKIEFSPPSRLDGGIDLLNKEWKIGRNKTSKAINMWFNRGELGKRFGQSYIENDTTVWDNTGVWDNSGRWDSSSVWCGLHTIVQETTYATYNKIFDGYLFKHCGTSLYKQNVTTGVLTCIYTGLTAKKGSFFKFNSKLYYRQTGHFIVWDGTNCIDAVPYIPTTYINRTPTGGGDVSEGINRIGTGFKNTFNGTGAATTFLMSETGLDATLLTCTIGGVAVVELTGFTVDRTTGIVNFAAGTSPHGTPASGTNNIEITAYKTDTTALNSILDCLYSTTFGGQNDSRVFVGGNGTGVYYWTDISATGPDATYWAYDNFNIIGQYDEDITGFGTQYDTLCIFKEKEIYGCTYSFNGTIGIFSTFPVNGFIGCDCPNTIVNIDNNLVWLNSYNGEYTLIGSAVESQRNVRQISRNINAWLLDEDNLKEACSSDYNGKLWLCVNDKIYLWDYFISPYGVSENPDKSAEALSWWYFDNINAHSFIVDGSNMYHVDRDDGTSVIFHNLYHDFGGAIEGLYRVPMRDFGQGAFMFDVMKCFVDVRGDSKTTITITYLTSDDLSGIVDTETFTVGSFSFDNFSFENFTFDVMSIKNTFTLIPNEKNIELFGIEFSNESYGRDLNISNVIIEFKIRKEKR